MSNDDQIPLSQTFEIVTRAEATDKAYSSFNVRAAAALTAFHLWYKIYSDPVHRRTFEKNIDAAGQSVITSAMTSIDFQDYTYGHDLHSFFTLTEALIETLEDIQGGNKNYIYEILNGRQFDLLTILGCHNNFAGPKLDDEEEDLDASDEYRPSLPVSASLNPSMHFLFAMEVFQEIADTAHRKDLIPLRWQQSPITLLRVNQWSDEHLRSQFKTLKTRSAKLEGWIATQSPSVNYGLRKGVDGHFLLNALQYIGAYCNSFYGEPAQPGQSVEQIPSNQPNADETAGPEGTSVGVRPPEYGNVHVFPRTDEGDKRLRKAGILRKSPSPRTDTPPDSALSPLEPNQ